MTIQTTPTIEVGQTLPTWELLLTPTLIVSTAIATRDFHDVHHDRDLAIERGSKDIFVNILTSTGLAERYVTDWAGPRALVRHVNIRLGAPAYPYDTLAFTGQVSEQVTERDEQRYVITVKATDSLGDHLVGTVTIALAEAF